MKGRWFLTLGMAALSAIGCKAQPQQTVVFEPVRFVDGTPVRGEAKADSLFAQDRFLADSTVTEKGDTLIVMHHSSAFARLELRGLPAKDSLSRIDLVPVTGELAATVHSTEGSPLGTALLRTLPGTRTDGDGKAVLWTALAPQDFSDSAFAVLAYRQDGSLWTARLPGFDFQSGTAWKWTAACIPAQPLHSSLEITSLPQTRLDITPGEYSGIAWTGGDSYAVVSDNLRGGGLLRFTIPLSENGSVGRVQLKVMPGTEAATGAKPDNEGVAWADGKLYVANEKQQILEFDATGAPTGKSFRIPADMGKGCIDENRGFEALTFNMQTGLFWTTTESPLKRDTFLPRLLRLQSFDRDGEPAGRYLYQTGIPEKSRTGALAYTFGVSAMAALDDGRLLVLEREVYAAGGSFFERLGNTFSRMDLYLVDPVHDKAGILRKALLCSFRTGALDLANFEGMCLGPTLPDGRRVLLLIADTQNSAGGMVREYAKVLLLR